MFKIEIFIILTNLNVLRVQTEITPESENVRKKRLYPVQLHGLLDKQRMTY